jgi:hypothetical protein
MSRLEDTRTSPLLLAAAWIVVASPLAWGVYQTVKKSIPLFQASAADEAPARPAAHR